MATNTKSDTAEIDKKKQENKSSTYKSIGSISSVIILTLIVLLGIIFYFFMSSTVLFSCKLGQSNIIPTNMDCYPYTQNKPVIEEIYTNIFITNTNPPESAKLEFPFGLNSKNYILDAFRNYKNDPKSNFFVNFIINILEGLIHFNNNALNAFLNGLNKLPEILIVLIGPILYGIYLVLLPIITFFVSIYYYFSSTKWLFTMNGEKGNSIVNYGFGLLFLFIAFILFWIGLFTFLPIISVVTVYLCFLTTLFYVGKMNNSEVNLLDITKEFFKFYKITITLIISFSIILLTFFSSLGVTGGLIGLLILCLIYFNLIPLGLFTPSKIENLTKLVSSEQAKKVCEPIKNNNSFFGNLLGSVFGSQKGGGNFTKELKKISKKLQK
jgi:hypothetical protein